MIYKTEALTKLKRYSEGLKCVNRAHALDPNDPTMLTQKGYLFEKLGLNQKALECYNIALDIEYDIDTVISKYFTLIKLEMFEEAIKCGDVIISVEPNNVDALISQGYIFNNMHDPHKALSYFNKALAIQPYNADAQDGKNMSQSIMSRKF